MSQSKQEQSIYVFTEEQLRELLYEQNRVCSIAYVDSIGLNYHAQYERIKNCKHPDLPPPLVIPSEEEIRNSLFEIDNGNDLRKGLYFAGANYILTQILNQAK